jgi:hypothetical protein
MTEWFIQRFHKNFSQETAMNSKLSLKKLFVLHRAPCENFHPSPASGRGELGCAFA